MVFAVLISKILIKIPEYQDDRLCQTVQYAKLDSNKIT